MLPRDRFPSSTLQWCCTSLLFNGAVLLYSSMVTFGWEMWYCYKTRGQHTSQTPPPVARSQLWDKTYVLCLHTTPPRLLTQQYHTFATPLHRVSWLFSSSSLLPLQWIPTCAYTNYMPHRRHTYSTLQYISPSVCTCSTTLYPSHHNAHHMILHMFIHTTLQPQ